MGIKKGKETECKANTTKNPENKTIRPPKIETKPRIMEVEDNGS